MGRKRSSGLSHNKNAKTYKTTDRQSATSSGQNKQPSSADIAKFFTEQGSSKTNSFVSGNKVSFV